MKRFILFASLAIVLLVSYVAVNFFRFSNTVTGDASATEVIEIPSGMPMAKVAQRLQAAGLISDAFKLRLYAKLTAQERRLKKGEYLLNHGMTPQEILDVLASGKSILYSVTFPEGSNIYDIQAALEAKGFFKAGEFLKDVRDPAFVQQLLGQPAPSLEGYLFPETYNLTKFTGTKELARMMKQNFDDAYKSLLSGVATAPLSKHELVTLASVVEKETGAPEERPMIASVFYNRLAKGMPLQSDPTILYGIIDATGKPTENITKADITRPNRYNTYTVKRLPFGPISNPGREALAAVFKPAMTEYLYFVSRNNGTHVFSKNYEQHLKAVRSFQLDPAARAGKSWRDLKKAAH